MLTSSRPFHAVVAGLTADCTGNGGKSNKEMGFLSTLGLTGIILLPPVCKAAGLLYRSSPLAVAPGHTGLLVGKPGRRKDLRYFVISIRM